MAFAALRRLGQSLLGTDAPLQKVQAHLLADEAPAAWQAAVELLEPPCSVEGLASAAVAAAACDHWEEAARILQGAQHPEVRGNDEEGAKAAGRCWAGWRSFERSSGASGACSVARSGGRSPPRSCRCRTGAGRKPCLRWQNTWAL
ncbi:unnamed protein product [Effrenium voratum]|nr:unnamed protein product [Effrenium voratum]